MNYNAKVFERQYPVVVFFLQHLAYYRGLRANYNSSKEHRDFWRSTCDAHLKLATVAWCNVFGSYNEDMHWTKVPIKSIAMQAKKNFHNILVQIGLTEKRWRSYHKEMLTFRNKYVAHMDLRKPFNKPVPHFDIALGVAYAYDDWVIDLIRPVLLNQPTLKSLYKKWKSEARSVISQSQTRSPRRIVPKAK